MMDPAAPPNREKEVFADALDLPAGPGRLAFVAGACGDDPVLCARVLALLQVQATDAGFLPEEPAGEATIPAVTGQVGDQIGRYKLREKIGEGGYGLVYVADQEEPVRRRVALKVIKQGMDTRQVVARFEAERQALALMDHPNIAKVLDAGATETGRPYFVMELVRGIRITRYCDQNQLTTPERLRLFIQVCHAIQHAHQKGIIHRDIKPSNVLVTLHDGVAVPKVIDFGIAKAMQRNLTAQTIHTALEQFLGTPAYASPEQAEMSGLDTDTRSDIYALGVLLYELLTGKTPFDGQELLAAGLQEMCRTIREKEPVRPSARLQRMLGGDLATTAQHHRTEAPRLIHLLRGDLDWIVMKCLEKDRTRRFETATGLAQDIERHLRHEPVLARPPSAFYRLQKFARRNRVMAAAGGAVAVALVLGLVGSTWQAVRATRAEGQARQAEADAKVQRDQAQLAQRVTDQTLHRLEQHRAGELFQNDKAAEGLAILASMLRRDPTNQAIAEWLVNELTQRSFPLPTIEPIRHGDIIHSAQFSRDGTQVLTVCRNNSARLWDAATGKPLTPALAHDPAIIRSGEYLEGLHPLHADLSADGARVATASADGTARIWEARTGRCQVLSHGDLVSWIRFSPDAQLVATACKDGKVRLWTADDGRPVGASFNHDEWVNSVEFSPDGRRLVSASDDGTARIWTVASGRPAGQPMRHARWVKYACFSPDGGRLATASQDGTARLWDAASGEPLSQPLAHSHIVSTACFSPDGRWLATASFDKTVRIWDAFTGGPVGKPLRHRGYVRRVAFGPESLRVVTASEDGTARVWDAATGEAVTEPMQHGGIVWSAQFSPDGQRVVTAAADGTARIWEVRPGQAAALWMPHSSAVKWAQWSGDGRQVFTAAAEAWSWDAAKGSDRLVIWGGNHGVKVSAASPNGQYLATAFENRRVRLWDIRGTPERELDPDFGHPAAINSVAFSPDSRWLITASDDQTAQQWDVGTGTAFGHPLRHDAAVLDAQFSPDARLAVTTSADGTVRVWHAASGSPAFSPLRHSGAVVMARFSLNGRWIATASADRTAQLWEARTGQPHRAPLRHNGAVSSVCFSPDSTRLVTASGDRTARVWKVEDGRPAGDPLVHEERVVMAEFSPDGRWVVTASRDGTARLWSAATGQPVAEPLAQARAVNAAHFSPDGRWVATVSDDWQAAVWRVLRPTQAPPAWLAELAEAVAGQRLGAAGAAEEMPATALLRLKVALSASRAPDEYERWAAWFFADRRQRPIAPDASLTVAGLIQERVRLACHKMDRQPRGLEELLRCEPTNALCRAALVLAQTRWQATNSPSALAQLDWLARTAMDLAPEEPAAKWARALTLARQGDLAAGLQLMDKVCQSGFKETCFFVDYADLLVKAGRLSEACLVFREALIWPHRESPLERHSRIAYRDKWARQFAGTPPSKVLGVFNLAIQDLPPRRPGTPAQMLDLALTEGGRLGDLWIQTGADLGGLADFLEWPLKLEGVAFDTRGFAKAAYVPVGRPCRRLHFLHTALSRFAPRTRVGVYEVFFADGERLEIPIFYGREVCAFRTPVSEPGKSSAVAWEHRAPDSTRLRLCQLTWDNPRPDTAIERIEFRSGPPPCDPVLLAITTEP